MAAGHGRPSRGSASSTAVSATVYFAPIRPGDVITGVCRLVDVVEKDMRLGPTTVFTTEQRWTNQRGELVRLGVT